MSHRFVAFLPQPLQGARPGSSFCLSRTVIDQWAQTVKSGDGAVVGPSWGLSAVSSRGWPAMGEALTTGRVHFSAPGTVRAFPARDIK
jgi:hypothetical protein